MYVRYGLALTKEQMSIHHPHMRGKRPASTDRIKPTLSATYTKPTTVFNLHRNTGERDEGGKEKREEGGGRRREEGERGVKEGRRRRRDVGGGMNEGREEWRTRNA